LKNLGRAFEAAWKKLRADGITLEETDLVRTKLAQWIIAYAKMRELDVKRLKENGLMGLRWSKEFSSDHWNLGLPRAIALGARSWLK
jgi:hypothetical protein